MILRSTQDPMTRQTVPDKCVGFECGRSKHRNPSSLSYTILSGLPCQFVGSSPIVVYLFIYYVTCYVKNKLQQNLFRSHWSLKKTAMCVLLIYTSKYTVVPSCTSGATTDSIVQILHIPRAWRGVWENKNNTKHRTAQRTEKTRTHPYE